VRVNWRRLEGAELGETHLTRHKHTHTYIYIYISIYLQTNKHTKKQTNKQTRKQTNKETHNTASIRHVEQTDPRARGLVEAKRARESGRVTLECILVHTQPHGLAHSDRLEKANHHLQTA
jgi:hypothetical protein